MRTPFRALTALALTAAVATPAVSAIKAMTLSELMQITSEAAHVKILEKSSFNLDWPYDGCVWTKLKVSGTSLRTGEPLATELVFLGSHEPRDQFSISEAPTLQDTRVGGEAVVFFQRDEQMPAPMNRVWDLSGVYRVEKSFGTPVLIGKGEGMAFAENIKLVDATAAVRSTHLALLAAKSQPDVK